MIKLFAVGFARETDELQLDELFSQHGLVKTLTIVRDQQTGISKGYAFVHMMDEAGAARAIEQLNGLAIQGRTLSVRHAEGQQRSPAPDFRQQRAFRHKPRMADTSNRPRRPRKY